MRLQGNDFPFWSDEIYTAAVAGNPNIPIGAIFSDPGNPPFFFFLARLTQALFGKTPSLLRLLPCLFSVLSVLALYKFLLYTLNDKKIALFGSFFLAINLHSIFSAQEFRCYSLCALFSVVAAHLLFKIIKENRQKDFVLYGVIALLMANTHYFEILILIGNFFFAMIFLKDNKAKLDFFCMNLIATISFLPYFLVTALNKALLNSDFNKLLAPDIPFMVRTFVRYNLNYPLSVFILVIFLILVIPKIKKLFFNENKPLFKLYAYSIFTALFLYFSTYVISLFRPIVREYYYISILPLVVIPFVLIFFLPFKSIKLKYSLILALFIASIFLPAQFLDKRGKLLINFDSLFALKFNEAQRFDGKKIAVALHDYTDYANFFTKYLKGDESFILYDFPPEPNKILETFSASNADVIYSRLEFRTFAETVKALSNLYNISILRTNNDVLIARLVKK